MNIVVTTDATSVPAGTVVFNVVFNGLKAGKEETAFKLLAQVCSALEDGKLDIMELATLYMTVRGLLK